MRELLLVTLSAIVGYIVFSAFSTSDTPKEAFQKIIEQPLQSRELDNSLAASKLNNIHEEKLILLDNTHEIEKLKIDSQLKIHNNEDKTKIELRKLDNNLNHQLAVLKVDAKNKDKNKDNTTLIILAILVFLLIYISLKYKKQLTEIELKRQEKRDEMLAKKEYAEKIISYISEGSLSFETEKKLLAILDELNGKTIRPLDSPDIYHPNPDIIQLTNSKGSTVS